MDAKRFTEDLLHLSEEDIRRGSAGLDAQQASVADEVDWWRVDLAVEKLMRTRCSRAEVQQATAAGRRAARVVSEAAGRAGIELPDRDVTRVARVASQIARGLVLGSPAGPYVQFLLAHWEEAVAADSRPPVLTAAA
jgi:hypothetical protein